MSEAMDEEFDTVAGWTAEAALALGTDCYEPAGCRGSGGPATLDRLLDRLALSPGDLLIDVGAGVGGPAGYAARTRSIRPLLLEPEPAACRASRRLFGLPTVQASATRLPVPDGAAAGLWSLGVLCTIDEQQTVLRELRRAVRPGASIAMLVLEAQGELPEHPEGNAFPTADQLAADIEAVGLRLTWRDEMTPVSAESGDWQRRSDAVHAELERRHGNDEAWRTAEEQSATIGRLLGQGDLVGRLLTLQA